MGKLGIDVSKVKSPFSPLPEANYRLKVESAELTKSKKGDPMLELVYNVLGVPEYANRKLYNYAVLNQDGGQFVIHQHALIANDDPTDPDPDTWVGNEFDAELTIKQGDKGPQNQISILQEMPAN